MKNDNATPRPWSVSKLDIDNNPITHIFSDHKEYEIAETFGDDNTESEANAELIVRAVNNYDSLLEACKGALEMLTNLGYSSGDVTDNLKKAVSQAEGR